MCSTRALKPFVYKGIHILGLELGKNCLLPGQKRGFTTARTRRWWPACEAKPVHECFQKMALGRLSPIFHGKWDGLTLGERDGGVDFVGKAFQRTGATSRSANAIMICGKGRNNRQGCRVGLKAHQIPCWDNGMRRQRRQSHPTSMGHGIFVYTPHENCIK